MQAERVVPVIRGEGKGRHVGSGYRIAGRFVLTAAHCVRGSGHSVWLSDGERDARVIVDGTPADIDLALLEITPTADQEPVAEVAPIHCGRVDRSISGRIDQCVAVGYPKHAARPDALFTTSEVDGWIPAASGLIDTASGRTEGFLTLKATGTPPRPLPTSQTELSQSPWRGMSGAAVFAQGLLVGVVAEHHLPEGDGSLTVVPIEWAERLPDTNRECLLRALGVESATQLVLITAGARARLPWRLDLDEARDSHWLPNARGAWPSDGNVWHFSGRAKILGELRQWLTVPAPAGDGPEDTRIRLLLGMPG
jgi:Trypsin-like peptidase domain